MKENLLSTLENSRTYTIQVADSMPAEGYDFKPVGAAWEYRELLHHIAYGIRWWEDNFVKGVKTDWNPPSANGKKKEIIDSIQQAYDSLRESIMGSQDNQALAAGFHATLDHITHHRGQATLYLRCKGITPPEYSY
ncbi:MAG TPA: DinB family protein [Puia sp.]|nr:DinB family protein [Puia sp.]